jgi:cephalosporin hydroxylase
VNEFELRNLEITRRMAGDPRLRQLTGQWFEAASRYEYSYHFTWLGRPIIQFPQDMLAVQEIIWSVKPDLIVETGIAHGGSLIFSASLLELLGGDGRVVGIDIDIRQHNRVEIERHPLAKRITMIQGSSIDPAVAEQAHRLATGTSRVIVLLDSNHTHDHVREELRLYSPLVGLGSYLVVFDTDIEFLPDDLCADRPWGKGNNPKTAVDEFLRTNDRFEVDAALEAKLLISVAPGGYLKRVRE